MAGVASADCSVNKYPLWLLGTSGNTKYHSIDLDSADKMVIGGSTKNRPFLSESLSSGSLGFPFFEYYDTITCVFSWSVYLNKNLELETVTVKFN